MNPTLIKVLAVLAGIVIGNVVNGGLISISPMFVDAPAGVDVNDIESIKANFHLYEMKHFIMPFLAHALGTLIGAFATVFLINRKTNIIFYIITIIISIGVISLGFIMHYPVIIIIFGFLVFTALIFGFVLLAKESQIIYGIGIGIFFLIGGIAVNYMIYHPVFSPIDIVLAYIPMGWIGGKLASKL